MSISSNHSSRPRGGQGTGLGLPVVYGIVRKLGGRIDFESTPGRGRALSWICRPWPAHRRRGGGFGDGRAQSGEHILLVDDDAGTLEAVRQVLLEHGYRVSAFADGTSALPRIRPTPATLPWLSPTR